MATNNNAIVGRESENIAPLEKKYLVKSRYAFFLEKEDGTFIVYSTFNGVVITFTKPDWIERLKVVIGSGVIEDSDEDELIVVFKNKKILVDPNTDELLLARMMYEESVVRNNDLHITLHVSKNCNFDCIYCGQDHVNIKMDDSVYDATVKFIGLHVKNNRCDKLSLSFLGGEPLLEYKPIYSFLKKVRSEFPNLEITMHFTTNGYLLTPDKFEELSSLGYASYQITVDGSQKTHDKFRVLASGKGTWEKILENVRYMLSTDYNFTILLRSNINAEVIETLPEFYDYLSENFQGDPRITIWFEPIKDYGNILTPELLTRDGVITSIASISNFIKNARFYSYNLMFYTVPCKQVCSATKPNHYNITYDGKIEKCEFIIGEKYNQLGDLNNDGTFDLNNEVYAKWVYNDFLTEQQCRRCRLLPLCFGKRCPKSKIIKGILNCNSDDLQQEMIELLKKFY